MRQPLLLDSNLTLLFVVGTTNLGYISRHKNLHPVYDVKDYEIVCGLIADSSEIIFTPHVLTETSNLLRQIKNPMQSEIAAVLGNVVQRTTEQTIPSRTAVARTEYIRLGLTDAVLLQAAQTGGVIATADFDLYSAALNAKLDAINFSHLKAARPDFRD